MFELRQGKAMRRNKPRQRGVREARPAGGAGRADGRACAGARCSGAGEGGGGEGRGSPPAALAQASGSPQELSSRPKLFYLPTNPPGSVSICCRGASLGRHRLPEGEARWGGAAARAAGGLGRGILLLSWKPAHAASTPKPS